MHPLKNFYTRHWVGPRKSASNRAPHLLMPALLPTTRFYLANNSTTSSVHQLNDMTVEKRFQAKGDVMLLYRFVNVVSDQSLNSWNAEKSHLHETVYSEPTYLIFVGGRHARHLLLSASATQNQFQNVYALKIMREFVNVRIIDFLVLFSFFDNFMLVIYVCNVHNRKAGQCKRTYQYE